MRTTSARFSPPDAAWFDRWMTTVGSKLLMGGTGSILVAFLILHLAGNLLVYRGQAALGAYSALLFREPLLLWMARGILLVSVGVHIVVAARLSWRAWAARPIQYHRRAPQTSTLASRTMRWTGLGISGFVVFHILHLTTGTIRPAPFRKEDVYRNVVGGLAVGWVSAVYLAAMALIGLHIWHGTWAAFRSLGFSPPSSRPTRRPLAWILALLIWAGFTSIPIAVLSGLVR